MSPAPCGTCGHAAHGTDMCYAVRRPANPSFDIMTNTGWTALAGLCCALVFAAIVQRIRRERQVSGRGQFLTMLVAMVVAIKCAQAVILSGGR